MIDQEKLMEKLALRCAQMAETILQIKYVVEEKPYYTNEPYEEEYEMVQDIREILLQEEK